MYPQGAGSKILKISKMSHYNLRALEYWDNQEASVNGVLGGFGHTTAQDLRESGRLLKLLRGRTPRSSSTKEYY